MLFGSVSSIISIVYWCEFTVAGIVKVAVKEEAGMPAEGA
jgi:hypothetical protein